jgi:hypothetical protein
MRPLVLFAISMLPSTGLSLYVLRTFSIPIINSYALLQTTGPVKTDLQTSSTPTTALSSTTQHALPHMDIKFTSLSMPTIRDVSSLTVRRVVEDHVSRNHLPTGLSLGSDFPRHDDGSSPQEQDHATLNDPLDATREQQKTPDRKSNLLKKRELDPVILMMGRKKGFYELHSEKGTDHLYDVKDEHTVGHEIVEKGFGPLVKDMWHNVEPVRKGVAVVNSHKVENVVNIES